MSIESIQTGSSGWETGVRTSKSDSYRLTVAFLLIMAASAVDVFDILDRAGPMRYLILIVPIVAVTIGRLRTPSTFIREPVPPDFALAVLFVLGLGGSLFGARYLGTVESARAVFLPMGLGLLYLLTVQDPTDREVDRTVRWMSTIGVVYAAMNAVVNLGIFPGLLEYNQYRNASFAYVVLGLMSAMALGQRRRVAFMLVLTATIFITYPSATVVLIAGVVALTLYITGPRASGLRPLIATVAFLAVTAIAIANFNTGVRLTSDYFDLVDKADANEGRLDLWEDGVARFRASPLIGSAFTAEIVATRQRDGTRLPYHNDFILFLAGGGLLGIGLFAGWIVLTEVTLLRRYRGFLQGGDRRRAMLLRIVMVTLNSFFVAICFNPVLPGASRSATVFGLYAIALSVGPPPRPNVTPASETRAAMLSSPSGPYA